MKANGFDRMDKSLRSVAIEMFENAPAIEAWRAGLTDKQRKRLAGPLQNVRRWKAATMPRAKPDALAKAQAALRHFIACVNALSPDQAAPLWQQAQVAAHV